MVSIMGTKLDLASAGKRQVSREEAEAYAARFRAPYYETSAKENINVTTVFDRIGYQCLAARLAENGSLPIGADGGVGDGGNRKICCTVL